MTARTNPAAAFHARLLDRLPMYRGAGREIAALSVPDSRGEDALVLVDLAVRRWLVEAVEEADDGALSAVLGSSLRDLARVIDPVTTAQAAVCARDAVRLADGLGNVGRVVEVGKFAARAADAGAEREWIDAAELAANALYAGVDRGSQYVADEARRTLAAIADASSEPA